MRLFNGASERNESTWTSTLTRDIDMSNRSPVVIDVTCRDVPELRTAFTTINDPTVFGLAVPVTARLEEYPDFDVPRALFVRVAEAFDSRLLPESDPLYSEVVKALGSCNWIPDMLWLYTFEVPSGTTLRVMLMRVKPSIE
jgi:hypothetical protein